MLDYSLQKARHDWEESERERLKLSLLDKLILFFARRLGKHAKLGKQLKKWERSFAFNGTVNPKEVFPKIKPPWEVRL